MLVKLRLAVQTSVCCGRPCFLQQIHRDTFRLEVGNSGTIDFRLATECSISPNEMSPFKHCYCDVFLRSSQQSCVKLFSPGLNVCSGNSELARVTVAKVDSDGPSNFIWCMLPPVQRVENVKTNKAKRGQSTYNMCCSDEFVVGSWSHVFYSPTWIFTRSWPMMRILDHVLM